MPVDGVILRKIVTQLRSFHTESLKQVYAPAKSRLYLIFSSGCIVVNAEPGVSAVYLLDWPREAVDVLAPFGSLLRKKLKGARLREIRQRGTDRVVELVFQKIETSQELAEYRLILELMGRSTNVVLVKEGLVVDALRRSVTEQRAILPRAPFKYYPMRGADFFLSGDEWIEHLQKSRQPLEKALSQVFAGVSKLLALEIVARSGLDPYERGCDLEERELGTLVRAVQGVREEFKSRPGCYLYHDPVEIAPVSLVLRDDDPIYFADPSKALAEYLKLRFGASNIESKRRSLEKAVRDKLKNRFVLLEKLRKEFEEAEGFEKLKKNAELIFANAHRLTRKTAEVHLRDWEAQSEVSVKLDPSLTPIENATKMMKTYSKLKRKRDMIQRRMKDVEHEIHYLESLAAYIEMAETREELRILEDELGEQGLLKSKEKGGKTHKPAKSKEIRLGKRFEFEGFTILVGRNNKENDALRQSAGAKDLWFHARGVPGAHVFLKVDRDPSKEVIVFAARIAASFSRARYDRKVAVDVTEVRRLRKPPKSPPGYVLYDNEETLMVEPLTLEELKDLKEG
ncbi:MAG: NFACT family protein [Thermotogae bacterium]|nr:NFACT family protein [Thermotogota bacterium]